MDHAHSGPGRRSRLVTVLVTVFAVASATVAPSAAHADTSSRDPSARRREVQRRRAQVASELNVLKATDKQIIGALDVLNSNVRIQESAAADARQAAEAAAGEAARARAAEHTEQTRLAGLEATLRHLAVDSYMSGPSVQNLAVFHARSFHDASREQALLEVATASGGELVDQMKAARDDLAADRVRAENAERLTAQRRTTVEARLVDVKRSLAAQKRVADEVEARVEDRAAEAESLASLDQQLGAEILRQQAEIARRLGPRTGVVGGVFHIANVALTTVRGIVVATSIAHQLESLLAAAEADGFVLSGRGYRSPDEQIAVRRSHCGSSDYAVYDMPASQCSPPTARPGRSMHEQGLAVDFTWDGHALSSSSPAFDWMQRNAGRFGFYNLPSEPWHWSPSGT